MNENEADSIQTCAGQNPDLLHFKWLRFRSANMLGGGGGGGQSVCVSGSVCVFLGLCF